MEVLIVLVVLVVSTIALVTYSGARDRRLRRERLLDKYGDPQIVERIIKVTVWQGETEEQVIESLGAPLRTDEKVLKTKTKRTLKYMQAGTNRFRRRIMLEDGVVVGWEIND